ncbi:uncharacterized protein METZ01_LOCUS330149 [marine metagenome]|uniref:Uncharacterized protein n=1 Tax=marine metagenome TaxID=408172 RepID=A0A382PX95_9ZZZZ
MCLQPHIVFGSGWWKNSKAQAGWIGSMNPCIERSVVD